MSNVKFTDLPPAAEPFTGAEIAAVVQGGVSKQGTVAQVKTYIETNSTIAMAAATQMGLTTVIF